ncbi:MAG: hypothetical protein IT440_11665, partial [Phycisphaeraceae bacterium]|nr:hypothetical protein [Phycisphaeraceae bacterium]
MAHAIPMLAAAALYVGLVRVMTIGGIPPRPVGQEILSAVNLMIGLPSRGW